MFAFIFAAHPNTAIFHAFEKGFTTTDYLLAHVVDGIRVGNWQRTKDAQETNPKHFPEPLPRPNDANPVVQQQKQDAAAQNAGKVVMVGDRPATPTTVENFLAIRAEREKRWREKHQRPKGGQ